jgi:predicted dehydrogenase
VNDSTSLIVGSGSIARRHLANLRTLRPKNRIVVLRRQLSESGELLGADRVVNTIEEALRECPKIAIVANPAPFHIPVARILANAGCHLLIEKPVSDRLDGVAALIKTCELRRVTLMVGYNLRYYPSLQAMARMVAEGAIGQIQYVNAEIGQYLPDWRPNSDFRVGVTAQASLGGGALLELSHEIDIALWLGGGVASLTASLDRVSDLEIDTEDCADILINFISGARGHVHMDLLQRAPTRRCRVVGSDGTLEWDYFEDTLSLGRAGGKWQQIDVPRLNDRNDMYLNELADFFSCVEQGTVPLVPGSVGRDVLSVALAARESAKKKKTVEMVY